jgi:hypothetical protein
MDDTIITKEFCKKKNLIFYPESESEAAFIQKNLFKLGFHWGAGGTDLKLLKEAVEFGLCLEADGKVRYDQSGNAKSKYLHCTSAQFDPPFDKGDTFHLHSDRDIMLAIFNEVSALRQQVEYLTAEIAPKHLQKDGLKIK